MSELQTAITNLQLRHSELVAAVKSYPGTVAGAANTALGEASVEQRKARDTIRDLRNQIENDGQSLILDWEYDVAVVNGEGKPINEVVTFSRSTGGGRFGPDGKYEWLEADVPRIDYDPATGEYKGLLIEEQRTNDFPGGLFEPRASGDPALITTVEDEKLPGIQVTRIEGAEDNYDGFRDYRTASEISRDIAGAGPRRLAVLVKPSGSVRYMRVSTSSSTHEATHNWVASVDLWELRTSRQSSQYYGFYLQDVGGEWVFVSFTAAPNHNYRRLSVAFGMDGQGATDYASWTPIPEGDTVLLALPQHYADTTERIKSLIPTTDGSTVTRAKDFVTRDLGPEYNQSEGTLTVTAKANIGAVVARLGSLELIADTADEKAYTLSYTNGPSSPVLELLPVGSGTITDVQYVPRATQ